MERLDAEIKAKLSHSQRALENELQRVEDEHAAKKQTAEQQIMLNHYQSLYDECSKRFQNMYARLGRLPIHYVPHWLYIMFATLIFLGEIPLNALVFQIFGENQVMTWVMAFIIGLSVPLSSHFVGIKFREQGEKVSWANIAKGIFVTAVLLGALYGLSIMRQTYLGEFKDELGLTDTLVEQSFLFYWLNVAVFVAAVILAYLAHDPVAGYQTIYDQYKDAEAKLTAAKQQQQQRMEAIELQKVNGQSAARNSFCAEQDRIVVLKGEYDRLLKDGQEQEKRCMHRMQKEISIYRHENLAMRTDKSTPKSFSTEHHFELILSNISEKLVNEHDND
jgi:hypothetical protein